MHTLEHARRAVGQVVSHPTCRGARARAASPVRIGNQAQQRLLLQTKPAVNQPGDRLEHEADRVAETVMRMSEPPAVTADVGPDRGPWPRIQRMCSTCEDEATPVQRKEAARVAPLAIPHSPSQLHSALGNGQPMAGASRAFMESRLGHDFSDVRIHADARAAAAARGLQARAFTMGRDVVFGAGEFSPETSDGRRLLAHELTHVVQQGAAGSVRLQRQADPSKVPSGLPCDDFIPNAQPASGQEFLFAIDSSALTLTAAQAAALTAFVDTWHAQGSFDDIQVQGFASNDGDQGFNWTLSCNRAEAVKSELVGRGVADGKIKTIAHGMSTVAPTAAGNRRAVLSMLATPTATPSPVTAGPTSSGSCPRSVSIEVSRGNDDERECEYEDARIIATIVVDPCACQAGGAIPITIRFHATLFGKSFSNAAGTIPERQASTIGQTFFLREDGTTNDSPPLVHSGDIGRPGDPDDTLVTQLRLLHSIDCDGVSTFGRVLITNGGFIQQIIRWSATADRTGVQAATIDLEQRPVRNILPPLRSAASPYPPFPGVPRDNRCACHPVTGRHQGTTCPTRFLTGGASVGGP